MSKVWTLDSLIEEIEREHAPMKFQIGEQEFILKSLMRCDKKVRDAVMERLNQLEAAFNGKSEEEVTEEDLFEAMSFVLKNVTQDNKGSKLVTALKSDLLLGMKLLEKWNEATQPGEATDSPS